MKRSQVVRLVMVAGFALGLAGCKSAPRARPIPTTRIDEGQNTTQAARKALEGKWTLLALTITTADGKQAMPEAAGELNVDEFGNIKIEYRLTEDGRKALERIGVRYPNPVISESGRAAIDPQKGTVTYIGSEANANPLDPDLAARKANPFALERPRYYTIGADGVLTMATHHDNGKDAAKSTWKKAAAQ
jgi:hypothetical protein